MPADPSAARLLRWLEQPGSGPAPSVLIVAAHPDDEVIGASRLLTSLPQVRLLHLTDGAPRNLCDAHAAGFASWQDYARARRAELPGQLGEELAAKVLESYDASRRLAERDQANLDLLRRRLGRTPLIEVPHLPDDVHDLAGLRLMDEFLFG